MSLCFVSDTQISHFVPLPTGRAPLLRTKGKPPLICLFYCVRATCQTCLYLSSHALCFFLVTQSCFVILRICFFNLFHLTLTVSRPEFTLLVEPPAGDAEYLIAEIQLPGVVRHSYTHYSLFPCPLFYPVCFFPVIHF